MKGGEDYAWRWDGLGCQASQRYADAVATNPSDKLRAPTWHLARSATTGRSPSNQTERRPQSPITLIAKLLSALRSDSYQRDLSSNDVSSNLKWWRKTRIGGSLSKRLTYPAKPKSHHAVELEVSVEADGTVGAVEGERDVGHICPPTFLKQSASVLLKLRFLSVSLKILSLF